MVTLDLGLYKPVQQLLMSRADLQDRWILRPGELHIAFAATRAIGSFVEGTGIPDIWSFAYSDSTINSIIAGKNFRRAVEAHTRTLVALQQCYWTAFFQKHESLHENIHSKVHKLLEEFHGLAQNDAVKELLCAMNGCEFMQAMQEFDARESEVKPTFRMI